MTLAALQSLERFLLPNVCVACERPIEPTRADRLVCGLCRARLTGLVGGCERCSQPLPPVGPCRFCVEWPVVLSSVRSAVWLSDEAREIVHHLKYEGYRALASEIAEIIVRCLPQPPRGVLVPIPLGKRRLRSRGYNQAEEIARALADQWNLPLAGGLLRRTRDTRTQTALAPEEREENVKGAFASPSMVPQRPSAPLAMVTDGDVRRCRRSGAIILIDDVLTTGATLAAAARSLEQAGWKQVGAVTFARALPFAVRTGV